jgi:hypothetical protein
VTDVFRTSYAPAVQPWLTFPFALNYQAFGGGYQTPQYRLVGNIVTLRGLMTRNTATAGAGSTCGTLPVGARPTVGHLMFDTDMNGANCRVDVMTTGAIVHQGGALNVGGFFSLDGIQFAID